MKISKHVVVRNQRSFINEIIEFEMICSASKISDCYSDLDFKIYFQCDALILLDINSNYVYLGQPNSTTSSDQQSTFLLSNETLQKLSSISDLNEIYEHVRSNDRIFIDKIQLLLNDIDQENENNSKKQSDSSLTLQSQVLLARNLAHTLSTNDQIKKK